jgi:hypothetical protein
MTDPEVSRWVVDTDGCRIALRISPDVPIAAAGAAPSVGTVGDALDNALAESQIGLFTTELIRRRGP